MQPEECSTTYQCAFQWPLSMPQKKTHGNLTHRPQTAPNTVVNLPEVGNEFAKKFDCGCKNSSRIGGSEKKRSGQPNCLHVNVIMPYQVNFNNIPVGKKHGKDGLNAYIYGSERKEALQAAAMKCTQRPEPTMRDINKKVDIKLKRPKTAAIHQNPRAGMFQYPPMTVNEEPICLTLNELKNIAQFVGGNKKFEQPQSHKGYKPTNSCNCGKP